ncbi:MAG: phosphohistidine phosphatase SixA [Methylophilaceae bacterium]
MELILWRHAEAEDSSPDIQRVLTLKGHKQAKQMAAWLKKHLATDTRILVSPALRTQQTALALTDKFITLESLAPETSVKDILDAAEWPRSGGSVLIVGHQPTLGEVAAKLLESAESCYSVKKGAVWWFQNRKHGNVAETVLKAVINPEML